MIAETISNFCLECVRHISGNCEGKSSGLKKEMHWGQLRVVRVSGFAFCQGYEFDERLYHFKDGSGEAAAIKRTIVVDHDEELKEVKKAEVSSQKNLDAVDLGESLSLDDFVDIL
jgi:hypothetical protein